MSMWLRFSAYSFLTSFFSVIICVTASSTVMASLSADVRIRSINLSVSSINKDQTCATKQHLTTPHTCWISDTDRNKTPAHEHAEEFCRVNNNISRTKPRSRSSVLNITGSIARSASRRYLVYSEADFEALHRWGWNAKFHPHRCNDKGVRPQKLKFLLNARFSQNLQSLYLISGWVRC